MQTKLKAYCCVIIVRSNWLRPTRTPDHLIGCDWLETRHMRTDAFGAHEELDGCSGLTFAKWSNYRIVGIVERAEARMIVRIRQISYAWQQLARRYLHIAAKAG